MNTSSYRCHITNIAFAFSSLFIALCMVFSPEHTLLASKNGIKIWWETVFPALLPFCIMSDILVGLGVVQFVGVLLEPLMRPLFNVPGTGGFVLAMGFASGYPIGAILTARLHEQNLCTPAEGERLVTFTTTSDPIFIGGAVALGMFGNGHLALLLMLGHYLSSLIVGIIFRFWKKGDASSSPLTSSDPIILKAFKALFAARKNDNRPIGKIMGDAVRQGLQTLLLVGGFIILFSVLMEMLTLIGFITMVTHFLSKLTVYLHVDPLLLDGLVKGFFEMTNGQNALSQTNAPIAQKMIAASLLLGWAGLSIQAQILSIIQDANIKSNAFVISKMVYAIIAPFITFILIKINPLLLDVFSQPSIPSLTGLFSLEKMLLIFIMTLSCLLLLSLFCHLLKKTT